MKGRTFLLLAIGVTVTSVGAGLAWWWSNLYHARSPVSAEIVVSEGSSGREVIDRLHEQGLLPSALAGRLYLRRAGDGRSIRWGHYRFAAGSRPVDVLERLLDGRVEMISATVVEGSDLAETAEQMARAGIGSEADWLAAAVRVEWVEGLIPEAGSLEGFFFPDTYSFAAGVSVDEAARHLVDRFLAVWSEERAELPGELWGSDYDVLILASLVEAETGVVGERTRVAGVYLNRLRRGMLLQCDPTVITSLKRRGEWTGRLLRIHWAVDDPYNTYRYPGLPPGPINSPGRAAIRAAMSPEEHGYLYFVAAPGGGHTFSRTLAEHNRAVAVWQRSRR